MYLHFHPRLDIHSLLPHYHRRPLTNPYRDTSLDLYIINAIANFSCLRNRKLYLHNIYARECACHRVIIVWAQKYFNFTQSTCGRVNLHQNNFEQNQNKPNLTCTLLSTSV